MKQVAVYAAIIGLFFIGDRLAAGLLADMTESSQFRYSKLYSGRADADVLFVGNSRGLTFYQPYIQSQTGLRTCNLSYNGLPANLAEVLVKDYIDRYPNVRALVLDVTLADEDNATLTAGFLPYADHSPRLRFAHSKTGPRRRFWCSCEQTFQIQQRSFSTRALLSQPQRRRLVARSTNRTRPGRYRAFGQFSVERRAGIYCVFGRYDAIRPRQRFDGTSGG